MNYRKKAMLMAGVLLCLNLSIYSQSISLKMSNVSVKKAMTELQTKSGYSFVYIAGDVDTDRTVSINASQLKDAVAQILKGQNVSYEIQGKNIVIKKGRKQQTVSAKKRTVSGTVKDVKGEPIIGATVLEKGTTNGTITDFDGNYTLELSEGGTLSVSYIGYKNEEFLVSRIKQGKFAVTLKEDTEVMDEVVVVGYGVVKKSDLTGSVSSVKSEDLNKIATNSPIAALQGRAAGVNVSLGSGSPDATASIQIRGVGTPNDNSPLYVVDGFPMSDISYLSPNDIESIEILKDASACAIYGSRGANGIVVISTKRGKKGALNVNFNAYYGIERLSSKPDMLSSAEYAELSNIAAENNDADPIYASTSGLQNTDWYDAVSRLGQYQNYNLSLSGGNDKVQSVFSVNYYNRDGIIKSTNYNRISLNQNNIFNVADFLKFTSSMSVSMTDSKRLDPTSILLSSLIAPPDVPVWNDETNYYTGILKMRLENPAGRIARNNGTNKSLFFVGNFSADVNLTKDLLFTSRFGIKLTNKHSSYFIPVFYETIDNSTLLNTVGRGTTRETDWTWENIMTYHHNFNDMHDLTVMGAVSARSFATDVYSGTKQNTVNDKSEYWYFDAASENPLLNGYGSELTMLSYLGRINYNLLNRYMFTASFRADGSSRFLPKNRWGYFPSAAIAWKVSEESFFKNWSQDWFTGLKFRAGYGTIGNENISSYYPYITPIAQQRYYTLGITQNRINGAVPNGIGNKEARWETSTQLNVGADLSFFDNRLTVTADYYIRKTDDILLSQQIPYISGFSSMVRNVGGMQNKGFEFTLGFRGNKGEFSYSLNGNFAVVKNEVTNLGTSDALVAGIPYDWTLIDLQGALGNMIRSEVGRPYGQFYGYVTDGIFQTPEEVAAYQKDGKQIQPDAKPGDFKFKDLNNDGTINESDMDFIGNPLPKVTYGLSFDASYKGFDLSMLFQGVAGNDIYNAAKYYFNRFDGKQNVRHEYLDSYWRGEGTSNTQPIPTTDVTRNSRNFKNSDYYVENGSYVRLKNIQLGYTFRPRINKSLQPSIRVYVAAQNLFTITGYTGFDPEVATDISVDRGQYPQAQSFMVGTSINF